MPKLGLIAGGGKLPLFVAREASAQGWEVIALAIEGDAREEELKPLVRGLYWLGAGEVGRLIELMQKEGIRDAVMAGKVQKKRIYTGLKPDARGMKVFLSMPNMTDDVILGAVAKELESEGITLHPTTFCLDGILASEGVIVGVPPSPDQWKDIRFGWKIAKEIGRLDIGQTVVVKKGAVVSVEAIEGTDEAIRRGGKLGGPGVVVVKVAKPQQDVRFDVPVVGLETILSMEEALASILAIEAGATIFLERDEVISGAARCGLTIIATKDPEKEMMNDER